MFIRYHITPFKASVLFLFRLENAVCMWDCRAIIYVSSFSNTKYVAISLNYSGLEMEFGT